MVVGVFCATVSTWAEAKVSWLWGGRFIDVTACLGSLLCGSLNLALAGVLGDATSRPYFGTLFARIAPELGEFACGTTHYKQNCL